MSDFVSRFSDLSSRFPGSDSALADALGVSKQTVSAWRTGVRSPKRPTVRQIAAFFNVGVPWLMGQTDDESFMAEGAPVPEDEAELLSIYRTLNASGQSILLNTARGLAVNADYQKPGDSSNQTA